MTWCSYPKNFGAQVFHPSNTKYTPSCLISRYVDKYPLLSPQVDIYLFPYSQISCQFVKRKERLEQFTKFIYFFVGQSGQIRFILIGKRSLKQSSAEQNRARQGRKILRSSVNTCMKHIFQIIIFHNLVSDVYSTMNRVCVFFSVLQRFKN